MTRPTVVLCAFTVLVGAAAPVRAQDSADPEAFIVDFVDATRAGDWARVSSYMHPEALARFKSMFAPIAALDSAGRVLPHLFGIASPAAFDATSADSLYTTFMATMVSQSPELGGVLAGSTIQPIGHLLEESTGLTHVVYRMRVQSAGITITKVEVVPLKQHEGRWRAMLTGDMEGLASAIQAQLGGTM